MISVKSLRKAEVDVFMRRFGEVPSALAMEGTSLTRSLPYFALRSSSSPKSSARIMQASTHTGFMPAPRSALQLSHFTMSDFSSSNWGAPYGHDIMHALHPMHTSSLCRTIPDSESLNIAPVGQFATHAGLSQWLQPMLI